MMHKGIKGILLTVAVVVVLILVYKCLISGHSMPIAGKDAISEYRRVEIAGNSQSILIRGKNRTNPVLLYLHGGPANPETSFIVPCQKEWEKHFTVVNWDQRGSGRSYDASIDKSTLNTVQICQDAVELTEYLKREFQVDKIYLVGHSYGCLVGMKCIQMAPEDYYAYVGLGQPGSQQENEKNLIAYARERAEKENNQEALSELESLGELPYSRQDFGKKISVSRKWTAYYGGAIYGKKNTNRLMYEAVLRPEYNLVDLIHFLKGDELYYTNTEADQARWDLFCANLPEEIPAVEVPVYFVQGEDDYMTSYAACESYYQVLSAPHKELIPLTDCAHNAVVEKTEEVNEILIHKVLHADR